MSAFRFGCLALVFLSSLAAADPVVALWPGEAPGSEGHAEPEKVRLSNSGDHVVSSVHYPSLTVYLPPAGMATGASVIVCPGGGHRELWVDHEGHHVARWLADHGIAAFVLKYRLAREQGSAYQVEKESLADARRALRLVRSRAAEWKIDPARLGIMGFSAGGELAALASRHFDRGLSDSADPVEREPGRPAFQALIYPGNSKSIEPALDDPPAFLLCGYNDRPDISEGLAELYLRFKHAQVPAELHIITGVGHGFGFRPGIANASSAWLERFRDWLSERGVLQIKSL